MQLLLNELDMTIEEMISVLSDIRAKYSVFDIDERICYHALSCGIDALRNMESIKAIINGDISVQVEGLSHSTDLIQEDVMRYKMICGVVNNDTLYVRRNR